MRSIKSLAILFAAFAGIPAVAQDSDAPVEGLPPPGAAANAPLDAAQQATYDGWPADARASYDSLPGEGKAYFWTLMPSRQEVFLRLSADNRAKLVAMDESQREQAWVSVEKQLAQPAAAPSAPAEPAPAPPEN